MDLIEIGKRAILCGFVALIVGPGAFAQSKDDVYTPELIEGLDPAPLQNAITRLDKDVECNVRFVVDMSGVPAGISPNCNDPDLDAAAVQWPPPLRCRACRPLPGVEVQWYSIGHVTAAVQC